MRIGAVRWEPVRLYQSAKCGLLSAAQGSTSQGWFQRGLITFP